MLFSVIGHCKPGTSACRQKAAEFLLVRDPSLAVRLAGSLRNAKGEETGFAALLEAESFAEIGRYIDENPDLTSDQFELEVSEFKLGVGQLS